MQVNEKNVLVLIFLLTFMEYLQNILIEKIKKR